MIVVLASAFAYSPGTLAVGPGKTYASIEEAVSAAKAGDTIAVYPRPEGYSRVAIRVTVPRVMIKGIGTKPVLIDGGDFDYSGVGKVPRAIFQFDPQSTGSSLANFELRGAHNGSFNGAGVRINQANNVTVTGCDVHGNDMGIMSNGAEGNPTAADDQLITACRIHENGSLKDPGYNHNLYLGGTSVTVDQCEIFGSLTGHNLKSRAHFTLVQYCSIHGSANRELDFVEAWDTERPNSNAVLLGNLIVKDEHCIGNRMTMNFGREKGARNGTLYLINNTIVTPFLGGVIGLSSVGARAEMFNNAIVNTEQAKPVFLDLSNAASMSSVTGSNNWISSGYQLQEMRLSGTRSGARPNDSPLSPQLVFSGDMKPTEAWYVDGKGGRVRASLRLRYKGGGWSPSTKAFFGAG